jgi:hypothetical protein
MMQAKKGRLTKKHVLIAVVSLVIAVLVVTAVLVAIRIYTDHNMDIVKVLLKCYYVLQFSF